MAEKQHSVPAKKIKSVEGFQILADAFYEASKISFSLVFFPIVILLGGVWLDKKFETTPLFIIIGIIVGVIAGIFKATRIRMKIPSQKGERKSG